MQRKPFRPFFAWTKVGAFPDVSKSGFNYEDLDFDKANEILFRLGIIYKQQGKYDDSLNCFDRFLGNPPSPLAHADTWFQIGHVYEQQILEAPHSIFLYLLLPRSVRVVLRLGFQGWTTTSCHSRRV